MAMVSVQISTKAAEAQKLGAHLGSSARSMLHALGLATRELSILLCSDAAIQALNKTYRGKDKPTDVLSFAQDETAWTVRLPQRPLGDIAISLATAKKQAIFHHVELEYELSHLLAHGLLHLLGFDHADKNERRRMMACTDGLLAALGKKPARNELWKVATS